MFLLNVVMEILYVYIKQKHGFSVRTNYSLTHTNNKSYYYYYHGHCRNPLFIVVVLLLWLLSSRADAPCISMHGW